MHFNWRILLSIGLLISYPWLFKLLLGGVHQLWHPDALTYIAHPFFDLARVTLAAACAAIVSGLLAFVIVFMLRIRARFMVWLGIVVAAFALYFSPFIKYGPATFYKQLFHSGLGNLAMALVVVCMPGVLMLTATVLAKKTLNTDAPKDGAPVS